MGSLEENFKHSAHGNNRRQQAQGIYEHTLPQRISQQPTKKKKNGRPQ
jgi:hypothetical protein